MTFAHISRMTSIPMFGTGLLERGSNSGFRTTARLGVRALAVGPGATVKNRTTRHNDTAVDVLEGIEDGKGKGGQKTNIYLQYICA
jgi:hypothetical protein